MGWVTDETARKKITVQSANIDADQTDFSLYIYINADSFIGGNVYDTTNGDDIRFTQSDEETFLKYERTYFNVAGGACTAHYWVKTDLSAASGATIWIYMGGNLADGEDAANTWRAEYKGVWHLDAASGAAEPDSTGNANNLTDFDTVPTGTGKIYNAKNFERTDTEGLYRADNASLSITGDISGSAWINIETLPSGSADQCIFSKYVTNELSYTWYIEGADDIPRFFYSGDKTNQTKIKAVTALGGGDVGNWVHLGFATDVSAKSVTFWFNGTSEAGVLASGTQTAIADSAAEFNVGCAYDHNGTWFDGLIDEVRVFSGLYPAGWVKFEHANMNEADQELTWGVEEYGIHVSECEEVTDRVN